MVVNGYAVNRSALAAWAKTALVAGALTATAESPAWVDWAGRASLSATAVASVEGIKTRLGSTQASAGSQGYLLPTITASGATSAAASCSSLAWTIRQVHAIAAAEAKSTGSAIPDSKLGEAAATATLHGSLDAFRVRPGAAALSALATSAISGVLLYSPLREFEGTVQSSVEATYKASGTSYNQHDGFIRATARCSAVVSAGYCERIVSVSGACAPTISAHRIRQGAVDGYDVVTTSITFSQLVARFAWASGAAVATAGIADPVRVLQGGALGTGLASRSALVPRMGYRASCAATVSGSGVGTPIRARASSASGASSAELSSISFGTCNKVALDITAQATGTLERPRSGYAARSSGAAGADGSATAIRTFPALASGLATAQCTSLKLARSNLSRAFGWPIATGVVLSGKGHATMVSASAQATGVAAGAYAVLGAVSAPAVASGSAQAAVHYVQRGQAAATASAAGVAYAIANYDMDAPPWRSMTIPAQHRGMVVPAQLRTVYVQAAYREVVVS